MRNAAQATNVAAQAFRPIVGGTSLDPSPQASHMVRYESRQADGPPRASGSPGHAEQICFSALEANQTAVKLVEAGEAHPSTISIWERMSVAVEVEVRGGKT